MMSCAAHCQCFARYCVCLFVSLFVFFFLMLALPPRSTLFPYTTLFRSVHRFRQEHPDWLFVRHEDLSQDPLHGFEAIRSEEHTSELQSRQYLVCRLLLEKKKHIKKQYGMLRSKPRSPNRNNKPTTHGSH